MTQSALPVLETIQTPSLDHCKLKASDYGLSSKLRSTSRITSNQLIAQTLKKRVEAINLDDCVAGGENPFFVADVGQVYRQHIHWKRNLPRIEPFYAVKCNSDPQVLKLLATLGTGFDCASVHEINQVLDMGVSPSRIIYANPCKAGSYIRYAASVNVLQTTFDNADELWKCKRYFPEARLFLRILTDDSKSLCQLGLKYGAPLNTTSTLIQLAKDLSLNLVGVSFHVGSGSCDPAAFHDAILRARKVFDEAKQFGFDLNILDVGGGFGHDNLEEIAKILGPVVDELFPASIRVIAEPGRYFVAAAFTLATNVIASRTVSDIHGVSYMYYVNDGIYASFNNILHDHQRPLPKVLMHNKVSYYHDQPVGRVRCSLWGPTCDSMDCIAKQIYMPCTLQVGDWLYFSNMGAYTMCASSKFNGFNTDMKVEYVCSEVGAKYLLGWA